jgi:hypothetical protein
MQGLEKVRRLEKNEVLMCVGNNKKIAVVSVGVMHFKLPQGFVLESNNFYYIPSLCKNIISRSCLVNRFSFKSENNGSSLLQALVEKRPSIPVCKDH